MKCNSRGPVEDSCVSPCIVFELEVMNSKYVEVLFNKK